MSLKVNNRLGKSGGKAESLYAFNKYELFIAHKMVDGATSTTTGQNILTSTTQGTITYKLCTTIELDSDGNIVPVGEYTTGTIDYNKNLNTTGSDSIYILETSVGNFVFKTPLGSSSLKIYNDNQGVWLSRTSTASNYNYTIIDVVEYTDYKFISVVIAKTPYDYRHGEINDDGYYYTHSLSRFDSKEAMLYTSETLNVGDNVSFVSSATAFTKNSSLVTQYYTAVVTNYLKLDDTHYIITGYYSDNHYTFYVVAEVLNDTWTLISNGSFGDSYYNHMLCHCKGDKLLFINSDISYFYVYYYKLNSDYTLEKIVSKYTAGLSSVYVSAFSKMFDIDDTHVMFLLSDTILYKIHFITMTLSETDFTAVNNPIDFVTQANAEQILACAKIDENRWIFYTNQWKSNTQKIRTFTLSESFEPVLSSVMHNIYSSATLYTNWHDAVLLGDGNVGFFETGYDTLKYYVINVDNYDGLLMKSHTCPFTNFTLREPYKPKSFVELGDSKILSYYAYDTGANNYKFVFELVEPKLDDLKVIDSCYILASTYTTPYPIPSASGLHVMYANSYMYDGYISELYTLKKDKSGNGVAIASAEKNTKCLVTM